MSAQEGMDRVNELINIGLVRDVDFTWAYYSYRNDTQCKYCEFHFKDPKYATFYSLRWKT